VEANEKLYINREEGFIGTSLKKDEFVACCSDIDDVIIFFRDGKYIVTPVADKTYFAKVLFKDNTADTRVRFQCHLDDFGLGEYLGEFQSGDAILVVLNNGDFYTSNFDLSNHYEDNVSIVEKFDSNKVWTAALYDADQQNYPYLKRFCFEGSNRKQNYLGENKNNRLILLTDEYYPRLEVIFGGHDSFRDPLEIEAEEFIHQNNFICPVISSIISPSLLSLSGSRFSGSSSGSFWLSCTGSGKRVGSSSLIVSTA